MAPRGAATNESVSRRRAAPAPDPLATGWPDIRSTISMRRSSAPEHLSLSSRRPWSPRPLQALAVNFEIDALVEERDEILDLRAFGNRRLVRPGQVLVYGAARAHRPVGSNAFIRAASGGFGWLEQVQPDIKPGNVIAHRKARLEEQSRPLRLGHHLTIDHHLHVP